MQIAIQLTITGETSPDTLRALLTVAAEFHTTPPVAPSRVGGAPPTGKGPNETAYLEETGLERMRLTGPYAAMDRETAALAKLMEFRAGKTGGAPPASAGEAPEGDEPEDMEDGGEAY